MFTILIILFVLANIWSESSSATKFCIRTAKALARLCRCTGSSEHSLLVDVNFKIQNHDTGFLTVY